MITKNIRRVGSNRKREGRKVCKGRTRKWEKIHVENFKRYKCRLNRFQKVKKESIFHPHNRSKSELTSYDRTQLRNKREVICI